jgi:hypothetical protein
VITREGRRSFRIVGADQVVVERDGVHRMRVGEKHRRLS